MNKEEKRFSRNDEREPALKYIYEHHISRENYPEHRDELRTFFSDGNSFESFDKEFLTQVKLLSYRSFLRENQHIDYFPHPRYIQQEYHMHDFFEMKYQLAGSSLIYIDDESIYLKETDIILISPYTAHRNEVYTDDAQLVNIVLPPAFLYSIFPRIMSFPNCFSAYFGQAGEQENLIDRRHYSCFQTFQNAEIRNIILNGQAYYCGHEKKSELREMQLEGDLEKIFLILLEKMQTKETISTVDTGGSKAISRMAEYMKAHLKEVTLPELAERFHYSASYASRYIKKQTGYTFQMLLLILRMEEATRMLRETDYSVDQIAADVGLTGKTYFYQKFRDFYGMNPGEYRRQISS